MADLIPFELSDKIVHLIAPGMQVEWIDGEVCRVEAFRTTEGGCALLFYRGGVQQVPLSLGPPATDALVAVLAALGFEPHG